MKKSIKSIGKIIFGLCSVVILVFGTAVTMFFFDGGRDVLLGAVSSYFKTKNITFVVEKLSRDLTKIRKILFKTPDGMELIFSNISLNKKPRIDKFFIHIDEFVLNDATQENSTELKLPDIAPILEIVRFFIADLSLGKGALNTRPVAKPIILEDLHYMSEKNSDHLYGKINHENELDVFLTWNGSKCTNGEIKFKNLFGFSGFLFVGDLEKNIASYKCEVANELINVKSNGSYEDLLSAIKIENALVEYQNKVYPISGNLYIKSKKADLNAMVSLSEFTKDLPKNIKQNFINVASVVNAKCDFNDDFQSHVEVLFRRFGKDIGKLNCDFQNDVLNASGNIGWIDIFGFKLKKLRCKFDKSHNLSLHVGGKDFNLIGNAKIDEKIHIKNIKLVAQNAGYISSSKPFDLSKESIYSFEFNFNDMKFWNKLVPISGDCSGKFLCNSEGLLSAQCFSKHLVFDGNSVSGAEAIVVGENINIKSKNADLRGVKCSDLQFDLKGEQANLSTVMNDNFSLQAAGKLSKSEKKISLARCSIKSPEVLCNFDVCNLDFLNNIYKVSCHLSNTKGTSIGAANISGNGKNMDVRIDAFQTNWLHKLNKNIPACKLDGSFKLALGGGAIIGHGDLSVFGLLPKKSVINAKLNTTNSGMAVKANINHNGGKISMDAFLPIVLQSNGTIQKNIHSKNLMCHILADSNLEQLLDLADKIDIRGKLKCDLHVAGSMVNPAITGTANLQNARFIINDVTLRNGTISLNGNGNNSLTVSGFFVDSKKKKLTINGNCTLSQKDVYPNINANLGLHSDNYMLLGSGSDSDNINAKIFGDGKITGNIDDLLISGDVVVPECNIRKFDTDSSAEKGGIIIENERNVIKKSKETSAPKKDFLKYDIKMRCRKINIIGKVFEIVLNGENLLLSTYNDEATLIGGLKMIKGRISLFGKRMEVIEGYAKFSKEFPFEPEAKFICRRSRGDLTAYMDIKNIPQKGVKIGLRSFPNRPKEDILSNIIFEKDLKKLTFSETAQLYHALKSFDGNGYIFSILNTFQNIGVIDSLSFSTADKKTHSLNTDKSSRSEKDMNVSAGRYLSDNVYISVNKTSEGASFDVDLSVTPEMSIKANSNGEAGLSWKYRY